MMIEKPFPGLRTILFKNPRKPIAVLNREVDAQLRLMVRHAYEHVSFYRDQWDAAGFDPKDFSGVEDLSAIPMVDKKLIVGAGAEAMDPRAANEEMFTMSTSGTSGCAIHAQRTLHELRVSRRAYLRSLIKAGARPWHRTMTVCSPWLQAKQGKFVQKVLKTHHVYPEQSISEQIDLLHSFRPHGVVGQTGGIYLVARELVRRGQTFPLTFLGPTGTTLVREMREAMREAFCVEPCDLYGAIEVGGIAWQCKKGNYHLDADRVVVEIVDEQGRPVKRGESGQVVVTSLYNYTMPFIRYQLLDIAAMSTRTCDCGCRFPVLGPIQGRINDFLPTAAGELVSPHYFFHLYDHASGTPVKEWRIIQESVDDLTYEYIPEDDFNPADLEIGMDKIREKFGDTVRLKVVAVDEVPMSATGKRTCILSKLRPSSAAEDMPWIRELAGGRKDLAGVGGQDVTPTALAGTEAGFQNHSRVSP
jgi:phenylacetate-CoA ligase